MEGGSKLDRRKAKKLRKKLDRGRGTHDEAVAIYGAVACAGVALTSSAATSDQPPPLRHPSHLPTLPAAPCGSLVRPTPTPW